MISALLLAAGASRRFGAPKLLQMVNGRPVVRWSAESLAGVADETLVIVAPENEAMRRALEGLSVRIVVNPRAAEGMASSLSCGVAAASPLADAVLVALGDEPLLPRRCHERVIARFRAGGADVVAATYGGTRGHPVLFSRAMFTELRALGGDHGARAVADADPSRLSLVEMDEPHPIDVDTPEDLARLTRREQV
ncbi:MAG TPA: nucleotidyltransferase family protein [Gemmatimonadaceae bacterium]